jgi:hypothetical protein
MNTSVSTGATEVASADTYDVQPRQVAYVPKSKGFSTQTLIPFNMASAAQQALERFEQQHGNIDEYLATRLGYGSVEELHQYFSAEQVDASALAISNIERGAGFITGDQTGIGKGRFGAANQIDTRRQGYIPIFVTRQPDLYNTIMNDLADIGKPGFTPFLTSNNLILRLDDGRVLKTGSASNTITLFSS